MMMMVMCDRNDNDDDEDAAPDDDGYGGCGVAKSVFGSINKSQIYDEDRTVYEGVAVWWQCGGSVVAVSWLAVWWQCGVVPTV